MIVKETRIIVVIDKDTEGIDILEMLGLLVISVTDVVHGFRAAKDVADGVVHWVVEEGSQMVLIWSNIGGVAVEALTHLENSSSLTVLRPEVSRDLWDGVNPDSIEAILLDDTLDPVRKVAAHIGVALVKIWQVGQSAVLNGVLIVPVDITRAMIVLASVERVDLTVVGADWGDVVSDDVDHNPDAFVMGCLDEGFEVVLRTEVLIDFLPVGGPVAVVAWLFVLHDRGDPNGVEAHASDIVKVLDHALVVTTAVVAEISAGVGASVTSGKSIRKDLVDGPLFPGSSITGGGSCGEHGCN